MSTIEEIYKNEQPNPSENLDLDQFSNQILSMTAFRLISDHPSNSGEFVDLNAEKPGEAGVWHNEEDVEWIMTELKKLYKKESIREYPLAELKRIFLIRYILDVKEDVERFFGGDFSQAFKYDPGQIDETAVTEGTWEERMFYQRLRNALNGTVFNNDSLMDFADYLNIQVTPLMENLVEVRESEMNK